MILSVSFGDAEEQPFRKILWIRILGWWPRIKLPRLLLASLLRCYVPAAWVNAPQLRWWRKWLTCCLLQRPTVLPERPRSMMINRQPPYSGILCGRWMRGGIDWGFRRFRLTCRPPVWEVKIKTLIAPFPSNQLLKWINRFWWLCLLVPAGPNHVPLETKRKAVNWGQSMLMCCCAQPNCFLAICIFFLQWVRRSVVTRLRRRAPRVVPCRWVWAGALWSAFELLYLQICGADRV